MICVISVCYILYQADTVSLYILLSILSVSSVVCLSAFTRTVAKVQATGSYAVKLNKLACY